MVPATVQIDDRPGGASSEKLPEYAAEMAAFHEAFASELQRAIAAFPWEQHNRVLNVCCGDGFRNDKDDGSPKNASAGEESSPREVLQVWTWQTPSQSPN